MEERTDGRKLHYGMTIRLYGNEKCFGPGLAELLERVQQTHSLHRAAADMGMAYSKAWRVLKTAEGELGFPLLHSSAGGHGGGGADVTCEGAALLCAYRKFERTVMQYADEAFMEIMGG